MEVNAISSEDLGYICDLVRERSAIVLEPEKAYLVQSRLEPLVKSERLGSLQDFVRTLRHQPYGPLHKKVVEALTTNETSFFRDLVPFHALRDHIFPALIKQNRSVQRLHIWCGASSSGQEPYSILFTMLDHFPELKSWQIRFMATDISREMLIRCQEGYYSQLEVNRGLPAPLLSKYFSKSGVGWKIRDDVRRKIEFREMNLAGTWLAFPKMDLVFLRNVMIYFDSQTKKRILENVRGILELHGYLVLGASETTMNLDEHYARSAVGGTSVYRLKNGLEERPYAVS
ncbi:MAG: protein-glutamate O-methyltransferase CheR [Nitrospirales bacterium]